VGIANQLTRTQASTALTWGLGVVGLVYVFWPFVYIIQKWVDTHLFSPGSLDFNLALSRWVHFRQIACHHRCSGWFAGCGFSRTAAASVLRLNLIVSAAVGQVKRFRYAANAPQTSGEL
jgi:hypothetical protein